MNPVPWLPICVSLLWACVVPYPVVAEDVDIADCEVTPAARFVACRAAAEQGNVYAQLLVGSAYRFGEGVPQDYAEAVKWYRRAAEQGEASAQNNLQAVPWYRRAAEQPHAVAQYSLGVYHYGQGIPQDYAEAMKWYRRAAEQSHAEAQYSLGFMYSSGEGVPQDYTLAHMWFNLAGASGHGTRTRLPSS